MNAEEVYQELVDSEKVFRLANELYKKLPKGKDADLLAKAIKDAKQEMIKLDVLLEDISWDISAQQMEDEQIN